MSEAAKILRGFILESLLKSDPSAYEQMMKNMSDEKTLIEINSMCEAIVQTPGYLESKGLI